MTDNGAYSSLRCTACGGSITPLLEYRMGSYSEHRDHNGYECDDCPATWDQRGEPPVRCERCFGVIAPNRHYGWLHEGGWHRCIDGVNVATPPAAKSDEASS